MVTSGRSLSDTKDRRDERRDEGVPRRTKEGSTLSPWTNLQGEDFVGYLIFLWQRLGVGD